MRAISRWLFSVLGLIAVIVGYIYLLAAMILPER